MICLENTKGYYEYHKKTIDTLLESKCFGLTFDIGHNYKAGGTDETIILSHEDRLRHFHHQHLFDEIDKEHAVRSYGQAASRHECRQLHIYAASYLPI